MESSMSMDEINQIANVAYGTGNRFVDAARMDYSNAPRETTFNAFPLMNVFMEYLHQNPSKTPESVVNEVCNHFDTDSVSDDVLLDYLVSEVDGASALFH